MSRCLDGQLIWRNWAGNQSCAPACARASRAPRPSSSPSSKRAAAERPAGQGGRRRPLLHRHRRAPTGDLVDLRDYGAGARRRPGDATASPSQAGIPLEQLNVELDRARAGHREPRRHRLPDDRRRHLDRDPRHRPALRQPGEPDRRAAAGHRRRLGGRVLDRRERRTCSTSPAVGLGALGIVSTVTLQCVPAFNLHAVEQAEPVDDVLDRFDDEIDRQRPLRVLLGPAHRLGADQAQPRTDEPPRRARAATECRDDVRADQRAFDLLCRIGRRRPECSSRRLAEAHPVGVEHGRVHRPQLQGVRQPPARALLRDGVRHPSRARSPRRSTGCGRSSTARACRSASRSRCGSSRPTTSRCRTAYGRDTGYIAVHVYQGTPYDQYFQGVERIMDDYGGRPHWGKLHFQTAETLAPRYPRWDEFQASAGPARSRRPLHQPLPRSVCRAPSRRLHPTRTRPRRIPSDGSSTASWSGHPVSGRGIPDEPREFVHVRPDVGTDARHRTRSTHTPTPGSVRPPSRGAARPRRCSPRCPRHPRERLARHQARRHAPAALVPAWRSPGRAVPFTATASARPLDSSIQVAARPRQSTSSSTSVVCSNGAGGKATGSSVGSPAREVGSVVDTRDRIGGLPLQQRQREVSTDTRLDAVVAVRSSPSDYAFVGRDRRSGPVAMFGAAPPGVLRRRHLGQRSEGEPSCAGYEYLCGELTRSIECHSVLRVAAAGQCCFPRSCDARARASQCEASRAIPSAAQALDVGTARRASGSLVSDQRPGIAAAGAVDREARLAGTGPAPECSTASRSNGSSSSPSSGGQPLVDQAATSSSSSVGDRLAAELPDHRAQLELGVEAEPVVDGVDVPVASPSRQWPLLRSVLLASRSKAQICSQLVVVLLVLVQGEVVLLEVGVDEPLQRALAQRPRRADTVIGHEPQPSASDSS